MLAGTDMDRDYFEADGASRGMIAVIVEPENTDESRRPRADRLLSAPLHVHEWGRVDAPVVVCLHGVTGYGGRFRKLAEERLANRFRVLSPDLRGHGRSTWEPPWDLDTHLDDVRGVLAAAGADSAVWAGHSFGGRLILELLARAPEIVERAVLLDPVVWVPPPVALERAEQSREERSYGSREEAVAQRHVESGLHSTPRELLEEYVDDHLVEGGDGRWRYRYSRSAVVAAYGEMAKQPPPFGTVGVRTLLVRGVQTDVVPDVLVELLQDEIGDRLEVRTVAGGHHVLWDAFDETADAVDTFLRRAT